MHNDVGSKSLCCVSGPGDGRGTEEVLVRNFLGGTRTYVRRSSPISHPKNLHQSRAKNARRFSSCAGFSLRAFAASALTRKLTNRHAAADAVWVEVAPLDLATQLFDPFAHTAQAQAMGP